MKMTKRRQTPIFLILGCGACVLAAIVFVANILALVHRKNVSDEKEISIGVFFNEENQLDREFLKTIHQCVRDILEESEERKRVVVYKRNFSETEDEYFDRLYENGVRFYFGVSQDGATKIALKNITHDEVALIASPLYQGDQPNLRSLQPNSMMISSAYLSLINSSLEDTESLQVVPVMRDSEAGEDLYSSMVTSARHYPKLSLTNPLVYSRSNYSRSDAFQVVNSLGATEAGSVILALSTDILPDILSVTHINPELSTRHWVAVSASQLAPDLRAGGRGRSLSLDTRLTTLAYLGHSEDENLRQKFLRSSDTSESSSSIYVNWLLYKAVWNTAMNNQGIVKDDQVHDDIFVSLSLKTNNDVHTVPEMPWFAEEVVTQTGENVVVDQIKSVNIDLGAIWESVQPQCSEAMLHYSSPGGLYLGPASLSFPLTEDTELEAGVLIAPLTSEVSISVTCRDEMITFSCKPRETPGDITEDVSCETRTGDIRRGRELDGEETEVSDKLSSVIHSSKKTTEDFIQDAAENFNSIIGSWQKLTPSVVGCFSSLAGKNSYYQAYSIIKNHTGRGERYPFHDSCNIIKLYHLSVLFLPGCDFCYYFLATYNLTVTPAACSSSCSLGVVGSCTSLITTSVANTFGGEK